MPFANPIVGGGGSLVYPSIHSPNFSIPLKMGWSIDKNGNAYFFGIVTSGTFQGTNFILNSSGLFLYTGTPANGNLFVSIASAAGTDGFSNTYKAGIAVYNTAGGTDYLQLLGANPPTLFIGTGDAAEAQPGELLNQVSIEGATRVLSTTMRAPKVSGQNVNAFCSVVLISPTVDLSSQVSPNASIVVSDATNTSAYNQIGTKFQFSGPAGTIMTISDGTNVYAPDRSMVNTVTNTIGNVTAFGVISDTYSIPAGDMNSGTEFVIHIFFSGVTEAQTLNIGFRIDGVDTNLVPVSGTPFTAGHNIAGWAELHVQIKTTGVAGTCNIWMQGELSDTTVGRAPASTVNLNGINTGLAINTTITHTMAIVADWGASVAGQSLTGHRTMLTRRGL